MVKWATKGLDTHIYWKTFSITRVYLTKQNNLLLFIIYIYIINKFLLNIFFRTFNERVGFSGFLIITTYIEAMSNSNKLI